jgi:hypothetical protein
MPPSSPMTASNCTRCSIPPSTPTRSWSITPRASGSTHRRAQDARRHGRVMERQHRLRQPGTAGSGRSADAQGGLHLQFRRHDHRSPRRNWPTAWPAWRIPRSTPPSSPRAAPKPTTAPSRPRATTGIAWGARTSSSSSPAAARTTASPSPRPRPPASPATRPCSARWRPASPTFPRPTPIATTATGGPTRRWGRRRRARWKRRSCAKARKPWPRSSPSRSRASAA